MIVKPPKPIINVTDIKQYYYCKRIIYFTYCQPVQKKNTYKMEFGKEQHEIVEELEKRRTLKRYDLDSGEKIFKKKVFSRKFGISGLLDMVVEKDNEIIPVEMKYTRKEPGINHKHQLAAYMRLLEEEYDKVVRRGVIHLIPKKESYHYKNKDELRDKVEEIITNIRFMINQERFPEAPKGWKKCKDCEYKNYCGDV